MGVNCHQNCEVCGIVVEVDAGTGCVQTCGLVSEGDVSDELDLGYLNDCPFEQGTSDYDDGYSDDFQDTDDEIPFDED